MDSKITAIAKLQEQVQYQNAILEAQKSFCAIYNSHFNLEYCSGSFSSFMLGSCDRKNFSLVKKLLPYNKNKIPSTDKELVKVLEEVDELKACFELQHGNSITEEFIFSITLSKSLLMGARKYIIVLSDITGYERNRKNEMDFLKTKERYHNIQQEDAFRKQMKIISDEVSYTHYNDWFFNSYYKPLDILSGDTYGTIAISQGVYLFYLIDAMGKGLSASVTSIQSSSFINNAINVALRKSDFNFEANIGSFCSYIKMQLLEDELLCATFVLFDANESKLKYASFGMPPILIQDNTGLINTLKSNNPPIMSFLESNTIDTISLSTIDKIAIFSDGLNECVTKSASLYNVFLQNDFLNTNTLHGLVKLFKDKTTQFDDDVTIIYMTKLKFEQTPKLTIDIKSTSSDVIKGHSHIEAFIENIIDNIRQKCSLSLCVSELLSNAFEHGNLGISGTQKQELIRNGSFEAKVLELETSNDNKNKKITVSIFLSKNQNNGTKLLKITIEDDGNGFDFSDTLKRIDSPYNMEFRGRGIRMSLDAVGGIYYNSKGKKVTILDTIIVQN